MWPGAQNDLDGGKPGTEEDSQKALVIFLAWRGGLGVERWEWVRLRRCASRTLLGLRVWLHAGVGGLSP